MSEPQRTSTLNNPTSDLTGKSAVVTGASRGIGLAIATELARRGASVVITARKPEPLSAAADEIRAAVDGATVVVSPGNAGDESHRAEAVAAAVELGGIDILVNNTGINPIMGPLMDADLSAVRKIFDVNVAGTLGFIQEAYRAGMREHGGSIVNISSVAGLRSTGAIAAYGASKAALIRMTEELAWELGPRIRVNAIAPSVVRTKFASGLIAGDNEAQIAAGYPMGRIGEPDDVARAVAFLAGEESSWITGETIRVDGGMMATGGA